MLNFSDEPAVAEQQMQAVLFFMVTFGYIDGDFDAAEKEFVRKQIRGLVEARVDGAMPDAEPALRAELVAKYTEHFREVFEGIDQHVKELLSEPVAAGEEQGGFVRSKLKQRCFEILEGFDEAGRDGLMTAIDALIMADGSAHPAELEFRAEMAALLEADLGIELVDDDEGARGRGVTLHAPATVESTGETHPFFDAFEYHYAREKGRITKQVEADRALLDRVIELIEERGAKGKGRLNGKKSVADFAGTEPFLDGHIFVTPPKKGRAYELTVLGDLHGCYSVLKAAIMQSRFFDRVNAFREDPDNNPEPRLVLLGDYIDRGMYSLNGVLRTVLQLFVTAPEFVHVLRGNHEFYIEHEGKIFGGVKPAEAINTLKPYLSVDVFRHYMKLFDALPNVLLFDKIMFVHGGIPRDRITKERWKDMSSHERQRPPLPDDVERSEHCGRHPRRPSGQVEPLRVRAAPAPRVPPAHRLQHGRARSREGERRYPARLRRRAGDAHHAIFGRRARQRGPAEGLELPLGDADGVDDPTRGRRRDDVHAVGTRLQGVQRSGEERVLPRPPRDRLSSGLNRSAVPSRA